MKKNFRIIEGNTQDYWDDYEEFIKLYNSNEIPVKEIKKILNLSQSKYKQYREKAIEENRLDYDNRIPIYKTKDGYDHPKYYYKTDGQVIVVKSINYKTVHFGTYSTEEIAQEIVKKLINCNWDKKQLPKIQDEVLGSG